METSWSPPPGRHQVNIGKSMARALKARKSQPSSSEQKQKQSNMPVSDFYLFRYNFKPESVDSTKAGTVEMSHTAGGTSVRVERASIQPDEIHIFRGKEEPAREVECVLIYNEEDGMFTLEKLDSYINLTHERKDVARNRVRSGSPEPTAIDAPDAEIDNLIPAGSRTANDSKAAKETSIPPRSISSSKPQPKLKAQSNAKKSNNSETNANTSKGFAKREREEILLDIEEEDLEFGKPAKQTKRAPASPQSSSDLSLPTASSTAISLPSLISKNQSMSAAAQESVISPILQESYHSESEGQDEWDEVIQPTDTLVLEEDGANESIFGDVVDEGGEEIDINEFAAEMDQELDEDEDEEDAEAEADTLPVIPGRPMSLNQFAGGLTAEQDDDYSSSSEDSSDD